MNKKILNALPLLAILMIGIGASASIGMRATDKSIPTEEYDALKTYLSAEDKQNVSVANVNIDVAISDCITFDDNHCKFNAILKDVIQSYDIVLPLEYCSEYNETEIENETVIGECFKYSAYTDAEIGKLQDDYVATRVESFTRGLLDVHEPVTKPTGGEITITKEASIVVPKL